MTGRVSVDDLEFAATWAEVRAIVKRTGATPGRARAKLREPCAGQQV